MKYTQQCADTRKQGYASCNALRVTTAFQEEQAAKKGIAPQTVKPNAAADSPTGYGPSDLQSAYGLTSAASSSGSGKTIAIVEAYDDPNAESDLAAYRPNYGLSACTSSNGCFTKVAQDGSSNLPTADSGWAGEISLDLDMASAICPNCNITLVEANSSSMDDFGTAVNEAASLGATAVSNSYGGSESSSDMTCDSEYFNHPGVATTVRMTVRAVSAACAIRLPPRASGSTGRCRGDHRTGSQPSYVRSPGFAPDTSRAP